MVILWLLVLIGMTNYGQFVFSNEEFVLIEMTSSVSMLMAVSYIDSNQRKIAIVNQ